MELGLTTISIHLLGHFKGLWKTTGQEKPNEDASFPVACLDRLPVYQ